MFFNLSKVRTHCRSTSQGFTLLEMLVVVVMLGTMSAIAAPSLLGFYNNQRLGTAQGRVFEALNQAKKTSMLKRLDHQVSFRENSDQIEWAVHPTSTSVAGVAWNRLEKGIRIDPATTLYEKDKVYRMRFNTRGEASGQLGQLVLSIDAKGKKRCVIVSTLLGTIRQGEFEEKTRACLLK